MYKGGGALQKCIFRAVAEREGRYGGHENICQDMSDIRKFKNWIHTRAEPKT